MTMKRKISSILSIMLLALLLSACGKEAQPLGFSSLDGLAVMATDAWTRVSDTAALYSTPFGADGQNGVDLALTDGKGQYLAIERYDCREQIQDVVRLADTLRTQLAQLGEEALTAELAAQGADEAALQQYRQLWQCPAGGEAALYLQLADEAWHKEMAGLIADYAVKAVETITLLDTEIPLYEYSYTNADGQKLRGYEASVIWEGKLYNFSAWTKDSQFAKSQDALKSILLSIKQADQ